MKRTFGTLPAKREGFLRVIEFPEMARMDEWTGDDRLLEAAGGDTRTLPLTIYAQFVQGAGGHTGAVVVGSLTEVSFDPDVGMVTGRGWLIDSPEGNQAELLLATQALRGNSVDLADIAAEIEPIFDDEGWMIDYRIRFTKWAVGATTLVGVPAFANAHAQLSNDEIVASLGDRDMPLVVQVPSVYTVSVAEPEITADATARPAWEDFHAPEADKPTPWVVNEDLTIVGHLGLWESCHGGFEGRCVTIPRPADGYASYQKPHVLTDRGLVETGPVFFLKGHPHVPDEDFDKAYGGVENAWADVRIVPGKFGPWVSGRVRPGVSDDVVYAARASNISGHWRRGQLRAIVSVNTEGYLVPGSGDLTAAAFAFELDGQGEVVDLIASFPSCVDEYTTEDTETEADDTDAAAEDDTSTETEADNTIKLQRLRLAAEL